MTEELEVGRQDNVAVVSAWDEPKVWPGERKLGEQEIVRENKKSWQHFTFNDYRGKKERNHSRF